MVCAGLLLNVLLGPIIIGLLRLLGRAVLGIEPGVACFMDPVEP